MGFEQGGYTRYSAREKSRVAEMQKTIEVLQREKETLQHTAGDCEGVGKAAREEWGKKSGHAGISGAGEETEGLELRRLGNCKD